MSYTPSKLEGFVNYTWTDLAQRPNVQEVELPGASAQIPSDNLLVIPEIPLYSGAIAESNTVCKTPYSALKIGRSALMTIHIIPGETPAQKAADINISTPNTSLEVARLNAAQENSFLISREVLRELNGDLNQYASEKHATVGFLGGKLVVQDLSSTNGTKALISLLPDLSLTQ